MKQSIFLDTNIVLDIVLERTEFIAEAREILLLRDDEKVEMFTSALTIANAAYIARKLGKNHVEVARQLLLWFSVINLTRDQLESSTVSRFKDFEDGLQYFAAREIKGLDYIITRDASGFKESQIPVVNPKEFLQILNP
jgi:predicted nucleic acid-binding protein